MTYCRCLEKYNNNIVLWVCHGCPYVAGSNLDRRNTTYQRYSFAFFLDKKKKIQDDGVVGKAGNSKKKL